VVVVVVVVGAVEDMVVVEDKVEVEEVMVEVEEVSLLMGEEAMEVEDPSAHMVQVEARKLLMEEVVA
jgi:hypothetical protein